MTSKRWRSGLVFLEVTLKVVTQVEIVSVANVAAEALLAVLIFSVLAFRSKIGQFHLTVVFVATPLDITEVQAIATALDLIGRRQA